MSQSSASLLLTRRLRNWATVAAILMLGVWLAEFSTHLHSDKEAGAAGKQSHHLCSHCAAFQPGAGSPAMAVFARPGAPDCVVPEISPCSVSFLGLAAYRSRAPPVS